MISKGTALFYSAIIFGLFMMGLSQAQCLSDDDTMFFKNTQPDNKYNYHFANVANGAWYIPVCYSDFFTDPYNSANPQNCNGNNWLFNISSSLTWGSTNSHASYNETPSQKVSDIYNVEICYGDLDCVVEYGGCTNSDYPPILRFNEDTPHGGYNLHGADRDYAGSGYPYFLCCNSSNLDSGSTWPGIEWINISTESIINRTRINTTVRAQWANHGTFQPIATTIIYENTDGDPLYNSSADDLIDLDPFEYMIGAHRVIDWEINDSIIQPGRDYSNFRTQFTRGFGPSQTKYATGDLWVSWCGDGNIEDWASEVCDNGDQNGNASYETPTTPGFYCKNDCTTGIYAGGSNLQWRNLTGDIINEAYEGEEVTMFHIGGNSDTTSVFIVFENEVPPENYTNLGDFLVGPKGSGSSSGSPQDREQKWTIGLAEVNGSADNENFRFDRGSETSGDLWIHWCGDNSTEPLHGEECDDGGNVDGDGCSTSCKNDGGVSETCGNNVTDDGEDCDWGAPPTGHNGNSTYLNGDDQYCTYDCYLLDANNLTWRNLDGYAIAKTKFGHFVMLHYNDGENSSGMFEVYEEDLYIFYQEIGEFPIWERPSPNAYGLWNIPAKSWFDGKTGDFDAFKFEIDGLPKSEKLEILDSLGNTTTGPPNLTLENPKCGIDIEAGETIDIEFTVFDSDSLISGNVEVDDEEIYIFDGVGGFHSVSYTFNDANTSHIRVYAENANGEKASANSNIIVINKSEKERYFVAGFIDEPSGFEFIGEDYIFFNASSTRGVAWYNNGSGVVNISIEEMGFLWKFSDGRINPHARFYIEDGTFTNGSDPRTYLFYKYFDHKPGVNWAKMSAGFNYTEQF